MSASNLKCILCLMYDRKFCSSEQQRHQDSHSFQHGYGYYSPSIRWHLMHSPLSWKWGMEASWHLRHSLLYLICRWFLVFGRFGAEKSLWVAQAVLKIITQKTIKIVFGIFHLLLFLLMTPWHGAPHQSRYSWLVKDTAFSFIFFAYVDNKDSFHKKRSCVLRWWLPVQMHKKELERAQPPSNVFLPQT